MEKMIPPCLLCLLMLSTATTSSLRDDDCDIKISIMPDSVAGDCQLTGSSSVDYQCPSLESALILSSRSISSDNCTEIMVSLGTHTIRGTYSFTQNIVLLSNVRARVVFNTSSDIMNNLQRFEPLYVLEFTDVEYVRIKGIEFHSSPGIIGIRRGDRVSIEDCTFRYFAEGAVDILNSFDILINNCSFNDSGPVTNALKNQSYSIHSGGLSIITDSLPDRQDIEPNIKITGSTFYNNSALPNAELRRSTNDIFTASIFTGRGGALGIALNSPNRNVNALVSNCTFIKNEALVWGGGTYIIFGPRSNHMVVMEANSYIDNESGYGAGALFSSTVDSTTNEAYSSIIVKNSTFIGNRAYQGGAIVRPAPGRPGFTSTLILTYARYENCNFIGNKAVYYSAIALVTLDTFSSQRRLPVDIINCTFSNNEAVDSSTLSALFVPVGFEGTNIFDNNRGGGIELVHAIALVKGNLKISNTATGGTNRGAFQLSSFGQIMLHKGAEIVFVNNSGSLGAALISQRQGLLRAFTQLLYNPLCFLIYEDIRVPPNQWKDVSISFDGNKAIVGAAAYTDLLYTCSWSQLKDPFFNSNQVLRWNFVKFGLNSDTFHDTNKTNPQWYVQTSAVTIDSIDEAISAYPGESFQVNVSVKDELGEQVAAPLRVLETQSSLDRTNLILQPAVSFHVNESELPMKRAILHTRGNISGSYNLTIFNVFNLETTTVSQFSIKLKECPPGFTLTAVESSSEYNKCTCNSDNKDIVTCTESGPMFEKSYWATTDESEVDRLKLYHCPTLYCRCFAMKDSPIECLFEYHPLNSDEQCNCNRKGILCGECKNGKGVSALLNKCTSCNDAFSILIVILVLVDIGIMIVILRFYLCTDFPSLILPCIFYIQFLPYGLEVFQNEFANIRPYLYYVSSILGFYFPYDFCLYSNASPVATHTFKFIPFILALIIVPIMLTIIWKFIRSKCNSSWNLVWLLFLLLYPQAIHTSLTVLHCPRISVNGTTDSRWFIDGSVLCFRGTHAPLGILAIFILSICVMAIPVTLLLAIRDFENLRWLHRLQSALHVWFKREYKWWYPIELGRRLLLILMAVPFPSDKYPAFISYCITMGAFLYIQPYSMPGANWLEMIFSITTILIYLLFIPRLPIFLRETVYSTGSKECHQEIDRYSGISIIGGALYYSVPVVSATALIIWGSIKVLPKIKERLKKKPKTRSIIIDSRPHGLSEAVEVESKSTTYLRMNTQGSWKLHRHRSTQKGSIRKDNDNGASHHKEAADDDSSSNVELRARISNIALSDIHEKSTEIV